MLPEVSNMGPESDWIIHQGQYNATGSQYRADEYSRASIMLAGSQHKFWRLILEEHGSTMSVIILYRSTVRYTDESLLWVVAIHRIIWSQNYRHVVDIEGVRPLANAIWLAIQAHTSSFNVTTSLDISVVRLSSIIYLSVDWACSHPHLWAYRYTQNLSLSLDIIIYLAVGILSKEASQRRTVFFAFQMIERFTITVYCLIYYPEYCSKYRIHIVGTVILYNSYHVISTLNNFLRLLQVSCMSLVKKFILAECCHMWLIACTSYVSYG
jgi:hypothetical protein